MTLTIIRVSKIILCKNRSNIHCGIQMLYHLLSKLSFLKIVPNLLKTMIKHLISHLKNCSTLRSLRNVSNYFFSGYS